MSTSLTIEHDCRHGFVRLILEMYVFREMRIEQLQNIGDSLQDAALVLDQLSSSRLSALSTSCCKLSVESVKAWLSAV